MNTCTFYVAHTVLILLEYLFNHGIKIYRLITYNLTILSLCAFHLWPPYTKKQYYMTVKLQTL
jgi:hypothetical protein